MEIQKESQIQQVVEELFKRAGFDIQDLKVEKKEESGAENFFLVKADSPNDHALLLEDKGKNLKFLEYLAKSIISKSLGYKVNLVIDLNNFLEKRNIKILELARLVAKKVQTTKQAFTLRPMSAYERRLVHLELADWPGISTESVGEEPKRKVIIKPVLIG